MAAARPGLQTPSMEQQFEVLFQRADLDKDGRISGEEAVAFFQGSNLTRNILAQIWTHTDKNNAGFLGRAEFYNALRLVTVAQSGRELTKEIIKAALEGPAAARIPPPQINPVRAPASPVNPLVSARPQINTMMPSSTQTVAVLPTSQNIGFQGSSMQALPNITTNNQSFASSVNQSTRPPLQPTATSSSLSVQSASQGFPRGSASGSHLPVSNHQNVSTGWFGGRVGGTLGGSTQMSNRIVTPSMAQGGLGPALLGPTSLSTHGQQATPAQGSSTLPAFLDASLASSQPADKDAKALVVSGNGFLSDSAFGGAQADAFSVSQPKLGDSSFTFPTSIMSNLSVTATSGTQLLVNPVKVNSMQSMSTTALGGSALQQTQSVIKNQLDAIPRSTTPASGSVKGASSTSLIQTHVSWPKMTQSNIQKYTKVFVEVDKDRDGKITGEEARNLFLSWRLPREVLKQVWDLADQDGDSMLSLKEFCVALYLMERNREGQPLPAELPNCLKFDDALLQATSHPSVAYGSLAWQPSSGSYSQQAVSVSHPVIPAPSLPQQKVRMPPHIDSQMQPMQQSTTIPVLETNVMNRLSNGENTLNSKLKVAIDADEKVQELENEIMDSKEKIEFYRTKMQDLVLYKSRCDNRLNEITEKASADRREVEALAKKYEEKYKQAGDVASKLAVEEATFRDMQERKLELYNAIAVMEKGGSADGLLQVRADRIQSDLEQLMKALNDRCKKYDLCIKPTALMELPFGWQPDIREGSSDWVEDWDKFEDDGFMLIKELTVNGENVAPLKTKSSFASSEKVHKDDALYAPLSDVEKSKTGGQETFVNGNVSARNPHSSTPGRSVSESPSEENPSQFGMHDVSPRATDNHSDHGAAESSTSGDKYDDESSWGAAFDTNDDVDSIWGFNTVSKESGHERSKQNSFDSGDFDLNPIRTGSPSASSVFAKERSFFFADSVPESPVFSSGTSPRYSYGLDQTFDSSSRFDSFKTHGSLARFDSIRSNQDFDSSGFFSQPESLARFDSIRSTSTEYNRGFTSFDKSDPFGTGPFKSSESNTPRHASDNWSAF